MKKLLPILIAILAFAGGAFAYFRFIHKAPPTLNPSLAENYRKSSDLLKQHASQPDQAIRSLKELAQKDPGNALSSYYLAAAYAKKSEWTSVERELKAGNGAAYCVSYQKEGTLLEITPNIGVLRDLARDCGTIAPTLSGDRGVSLLMDIRQMGTRLASMDPKLIINVLVGVAIRIIADRNLVQVYTGKSQTKEAEAAQQRMDAERGWVQSPEFKQEAGLNDPNNKDDSLLAKYHVTEQEFKAAMEGKSQPDATKQKLKGLNAELLARERTRTEKLLKAMPD